MRWSKTFIPTLKEDPAEAEIPSHKLMLRAGLIRQLMAGAYSYLPLGLRALKKAEQIVRQEMDRAGAVEVLLPAIHPMGLWEKTGRAEAFGRVLIHFKIDRRDTQVHLALGPTHEEVITDLASRHISSYRQLPITFYQIQTKFRNEERPRFGVLRTSEFLMKDAYSFDASLEQLNESYRAMYDAYCRIFSRCGLDYLAVEAESGPIGGDVSHEFMVPAPNGEDELVLCVSCGYAANRERAEVGAPGGADAQGRRVYAEVPDNSLPEPAPPTEPLKKVPTPGATTIEQVSALLGCEPRQMLKTLIYVATVSGPPLAKETAAGEPIAVLIRGDHEANEAKIRRTLGASALELADPATIERVTGAPVGFAGPVGIRCRVIADRDALTVRNGVTGANERDAHLTGVNPGRDFPIPPAYDLRMAVEGDYCPRCAGPMEVRRGIEVGHVFKLGTKYSEALGAYFHDEREERRPLIMGCYGIGVNRIVAAAIETRHDKDGIIWPVAIAPYEVLLVPLNVSNAEVMAEAERVYADLQGAGIDVLLDDRDARPGFKLKDADLLGIPLRTVIGERGLKEGVAELKWRHAPEVRKVALAEAAETVIREVEAARPQ